MTGASAALPRPASSDPVAAWGAFTTAVAARLQQGHDSYGDRSFHAEPVLAGEIAEELLDVAAWAFILWTWLDAVREAVSR